MLEKKTISYDGTEFKHLGEIVSYLLKKKGLKQENLADECATSSGTISRWISTGKIPAVAERKLKQFLGVNDDGPNTSLHKAWEELHSQMEENRQKKSPKLARSQKLALDMYLANSSWIFSYSDISKMKKESSHLTNLQIMAKFFESAECTKIKEKLLHDAANGSSQAVENLVSIYQGQYIVDKNSATRHLSKKPDNKEMSIMNKLAQMKACTNNWYHGHDIHHLLAAYLDENETNKIIQYSHNPYLIGDIAIEIIEIMSWSVVYKRPPSIKINKNQLSTFYYSDISEDISKLFSRINIVTKYLSEESHNSYKDIYLQEFLLLRKYFKEKNHSWRYGDCSLACARLGYLDKELQEYLLKSSKIYNIYSEEAAYHLYMKKNPGFMGRFNYYSCLTKQQLRRAIYGYELRSLEITN